MDRQLPIVKELNIEPDVVLIFEKLRREPYSFLLESSMVLRDIGEYSFLGCDPFLIMRSKDDEIEIYREGNVERHTGNQLVKLNELLADFNYTPGHKLFPFNGGAVGFFSYDLGRQIEILPSDALDDLNTPDTCLGFYDIVVVIEHLTKKVYISSTGHPLRGREGLDRAVSRAEELINKIIEPAGSLAHYSHKGGLPQVGVEADIFGDHVCHNDIPEDQTQETLHPFAHPAIPCVALPIAQGGLGIEQLKSNFTPGQYMDAVQRSQDYIRAGDIFEVNITQRFEAPLLEDPWEVYKRLRQTNQAPFSGFLNFGGFQVLSSSPERFVKVQGNRVETRPIKGTRPRGRDLEGDKAYRQELLTSEKDKAELMMIVDLERNDLGKVCEIGSVHVPDLVRLEEYVTVFHLVSTVEGTLLPGKTVCDLLEAAFPGGSITGAPKIRSMEIIEELEKIRRGVYTGSIGYIDFNGDADLNIVIRTIICRNGKAYFQVGGAITIDSDPKSEYYETLDKAKGIMKALGFDKGEINGWRI